jgi:uncharacterized membrane protein
MDWGMWIIVTMLWLPWAALALWMVRQLGLRRSVNDGGSAEEIAKRSYAKGDISRERYMEMMADLSGGGGAGPGSPV